jgi:hypothetical protein
MPTWTVYIAGAALILAIAAGGYVSGKKVGHAERDRQHAEALADWHKRETQLLADLQRAGEKVKVIYRDRYKTIEKATGDCLDTPLPAAIVDSVQ